MSHESSTTTKQRALLVSVYKGSNNREICIEHLTELALLAETFGIEPVEQIPCLVRRFDASTFVTEGKLDELITRAKEVEADLIVFDDEIAPSQQRNLEKKFGIPVVDRTGVILEVFGQRAQTKEARLQIELAKVKYQAPRLKRLWTHLSRQAGTGSSGGGGYLKGEGEKQIEIDRRLMRKKIDQLQQEIKEVRAHRDTQRVARIRSEIPVFAIVGYTNAGKSTLLNALTDANVFVEDKLFATLDTTTRKFSLKNNQDVLFIDTVGFIRKLPHLLVAAFKSTLEEAIQADFLIHLIDASHPMAEEQAATTFEVLKQLGAEEKTIITVLNKIDLCHDSEQLERLRLMHPHTVLISALKKQGFDALQDLMIEELNKRRQLVSMRIPQKEYHIVSEILRNGHIISQEYEENDICLVVDVTPDIAGKYSKYVEKK